MGQLEIKHLKAVRAISRAGTMTRAAKVLCLTQSALSQQLKDLEAKLGTLLFFRTRKQMLLTPSGRKVLAAAEQVIRTLEDTELDIARMVSGETGELRVGTQCIFCYRWLPGVMGRFQETFPNVEVEIGNSVDPARELTSEMYDLVITILMEPLDDTISIPLFRDEIRAVLPVDHPLAQKSFLELTDFGRANMISARPRQKNRFYQDALVPRGIEPKRFMTVEDPNAMIEMVAAGFGIALAPVWAIRSLAEAGRVRTLRITKPGIYLTWQATYMKDDNPPIFLTEFVRMVSRAGVATVPASPAA